MFNLLGTDKSLKFHFPCHSTIAFFSKNWPARFPVRHLQISSRGILRMVLFVCQNYFVKCFYSLLSLKLCSIFDILSYPFWVCYASAVMLTFAIFFFNYSSKLHLLPKYFAVGALLPRNLLLCNSTSSAYSIRHASCFSALFLDELSDVEVMIKVITFWCEACAWIYFLVCISRFLYLRSLPTLPNFRRPSLNLTLGLSISWTPPNLLTNPILSPNY